MIVTDRTDRSAGKLAGRDATGRIEQQRASARRESHEGP
jgi:hypothetical protein